MNDSEFIAKVAGIAAEWNDAEKWVKSGENTGRAAVTPAINELRYAGRRLVDAFAAYQNGNAQEAETLLADVGHTLDKARHDVVDAQASFYAEKAAMAMNKIGRAAAQKHFPKYAELFALIKMMGQKTEEARADRTRREEIYAELLGQLASLKNLCAEFEVSVDPIGESLRQERARRRKALAITVVVAAVGWVVALITIVFRWLV